MDAMAWSQSRAANKEHWLVILLKVNGTLLEGSWEGVGSNLKGISIGVQWITSLNPRLALAVLEEKDVI